MAKIIGLTGGIASGKSTVSKMLKAKGFTIVDADIAARKVVEPGEPAYEQIIEAFGEGILLEDLTIDRKKLGALIFADEALRMKLNSIVHPAVRAWMTREKDRAIENGEKTVFLDIPLLFESRLTYMVERTILVYVDEETQLKRLMAQRPFRKRSADADPGADAAERKKALADAVIDNNGSPEETKQQLEKIVSDWQLVP